MCFIIVETVFIADSFTLFMMLLESKFTAPSVNRIMLVIGDEVLRVNCNGMGPHPSIGRMAKILIGEENT